MNRLLTAVCTPIVNINKKLSPRTRQTTLTVLGLLFVVNLTAGLYLPAELRYMVVVSVGILLSIFMVAVLVEADAFSAFSFKRIPLILTECIGLCFLFNGLYLRVLAYIAIGLVFSFAVPVLHKVIASYGAESFIRAVTDGLLISYGVVFFAMLFFGPVLTSRHYVAIFGNPNGFSNYLSVISTSALIQMRLSGRENKKRYILLCTVLVSTLALCLFAYSRTGLLSIVSQILFYGLVGLVDMQRSGQSRIVLRALRSCGLSLLALVVSMVFLYGLLGPVKLEATQAVYRLFNSQAADDLKDSGSIADVYDTMDSYLTKGLDGEGGGEDAFTSGRLAIWKTFFQGVRLTGHASEALETRDSQRHYENTTAHNVYLQMAYSAGLPAGIAMILLVLWVAWTLLTELRSAAKGGELSLPLLFAVLCALNFAFPSLTSSGYMLFTYFPSTLFWFSLSALTVKQK